MVSPPGWLFALFVAFCRTNSFALFVSFYYNMVKPKPIICLICTKLKKVLGMLKNRRFSSPIHHPVHDGPLLRGRLAQIDAGGLDALVAH